MPSDKGNLPSRSGSDQLPLVSVVVTTFNRENLLRETITAIFAQTFRNFELLIIDNNSTDGTEQLVAELTDERVRYIRNNNGGMVAINRNLGIRLAKGQFLAYCDDDDLWLPEKLAKQVAALEADPSAVTCGCSILIKMDEAKDLIPRLRWTGAVSLHNMYFRNYLGTSCAMTKTDVLRDLGGFDESRDYSPYEDYELWLRLVARNRALMLKEPLVIYRIHGTNSSPHRARGARLVLKVLHSMRSRINARGPWYWSCMVIRFAHWVILEALVRIAVRLRK